MTDSLRIPGANVLAVDPGTTRSAFAYLQQAADGAWLLCKGAKVSNPELIQEIRSYNPVMVTLVIEMLGHYGTGMSVGKEVFQTAILIGRLIEAWGREESIELVLRKSYAAHLCGDARAKDGNIRQAVIDRFGGDSKAIGNQKCVSCGGMGGTGRGKERAVCPECQGSKRSPKGPFFDVTADVWQALGLAVAYTEGVKVIPLEEWAGN
jgi:hypothetical protein